mgnify:FL=1|jgi:hypothetical protein
MKKIFNRVKDWCIEYKEDIKTCYMMLVTVIVVIIGLFTWALIAMCNDLVGVVETRNNEIEGYKEEIKYLTIEKNKAEAAKDSIIQTYEDSIPKQQYLDDIEYLESVILELRTQCEKECKSNN